MRRLPAFRRRRAALRLETLECRQVPATFTVTTLANTGGGSLRDALTQANTATGADVIDFQPGLAGTITLDSQINITDAVTIQGPGSGNLTVSGNNAVRVFNINTTTAGAAVTLSGLTLTKGKATNGGLVLATDEALTLDRCVFSNGVASFRGGGVYMSSDGKLTLTDSTFTNNSAALQGGGVIASTNGVAVVIQRSTFTGNTASAGGGLCQFNGGTLSIQDSTFSGNSATAPNGGGGVYFFGIPAAGDVLVRNSTLVGNSSAGPGGAIVFAVSGPLTVENCTLTGNSAAGEGGGVAQTIDPASVLDLKNSVVSGNLSPTPSKDLYSLGTINATFSGIGTFVGAKNYTADSTTTSLLGADLKLGSLSNNGGATSTVPLLSLSPAINMGGTVGFANDQRGTGYSRQVGSAPDIGAFEFIPGAGATAAVTVGDGTSQRSMVKSLAVQFSGPVSFVPGIADAITLTRIGPGAPVTNVVLAYNQVGNGVTITFNDPVFAPVAGSLADGRYQLTLHATKILAAGVPLDGDGNGIPGDDRVVEFHRLFGDSNGDAFTDNVDLIAFRAAFLAGGPSIFDYDGDSNTDLSDFVDFRERLGKSV